MTTRPPRRADETLDALAEAFDTVAPHDRAAAEEELLDAGLDPRAVARRGAERSGHTHPRTAPETVPGAVGGRHRQRWAIAAALLLAVGAALFAGRSRPEPATHSAPSPRTFGAPTGRVGPEVVEPGQADRQGAQLNGSTRRNRSEGGSGGRSSAASGTLAAEQAALLPLLPETLEPLMRRGIVSLRKVAIDATLVAGLQSAAFLEMSAANRGRYEIAPSCRLQPRGHDVPEDERFGYPFPTIDRESPTAGCEIVWNADAAFAAGGGRRGSATVCGAAASYRERSDEQATQCWDARFASLAFAGRPDGPIDNPNALRASNMLFVEGLPDGTGLALLSWHPMGDGAAAHWLYTGKTRRVRRFTALDPPVADDRLRLTLDDFDCFSAAPEQFDWSVRGQREILAPLSGEGIALQRGGGDVGREETRGDTLTVMRRNAWVVEGRDRKDRRVVLYIDSELYRPYWKVEYQGADVVATFACGAGWTQSPDGVVPLTSSVVRFDSRGNRIDRFMPTDETIDPSLRDEHVSLKALIAMER